MSAYDHSSQVAELTSKVKAIKFAMFTTVDQYQHLISRPMTCQDIDSDGNLWFYTSTQADIWENIAAQPDVNLSFSNPEDSVYVSVSGRAERVVDRAEIKARWNPAVQAWFPAGPDDPHAVLIRVVSDTAEYWDSNSSSMVQLYQMAKSVLTGTKPHDGEHGRLKL
ncbi:MAG TPA: pyridoxamine 5'-phosphate oxidase family protein [Telluria sp.]|jgi:general stress protein 26